MTIRVSIAAPSAIFRAGLESAVRNSGSLELARVLSTEQLADEREEPTDDRAADVLLLALPQLDEEWIATLRERDTPVVLLTDTTEPSLLAAALRSTVRSLLSPDAAPPEIVAALHAAAAGLFTVHRPTLDLLLSEQRPAPAELEEPLSPREREVLAMLAEGLSNKLIAYRLSISEHTVKFHVTSIMAKLRAASRTDAVMQGIRRGLVMI